jgi:hypothetical protein
MSQCMIWNTKEAKGMYLSNNISSENTDSAVSSVLILQHLYWQDDSLDGLLVNFSE